MDGEKFSDHRRRHAGQEERFTLPRPHSGAP
jgi:hypothetical protein